MFLCGVVATIMGGNLADRIGPNNVLKIGWILLIPTVFFFTRVTNIIGARLILIPLSFGLQMITTPMTLMGQRYLPSNIGFAAGVTMGLGISIGGVFAPLVGSYADIHGLTAALRLLSILPFIATLVALIIKPPKYS